MAKIDPDGSSVLQADHAVREVTIADTEDILARAEDGVGPREAAAERKKSLRAGGETHVGSPGQREINLCQ